MSISTSPESRRSQVLDTMPVPLLKQETVQTQTAAIDTVPGATMTSDAYIQALTGALKKTHLPNGLCDSSVAAITVERPPARMSRGSSSAE